jgi:hypothetical protein
MKINIGPYSGDLIPVRRWELNYEMWRSGGSYHDEEDWNLVDRLVYKAFEGLYHVFRPINRWSNDRDRRIKIHIDNYDVWNADNTLALVIHPMLVKLKEGKHGSPTVDLEDAPEDPSDVHSRWEWVLNEMIWTFEQLSKDDKGDDQFHHNPEQLELTRSSEKALGFNHQKDPAKPKYWVDIEAQKLHHSRIDNGLRLFAKYYNSLWD